MEGRHSHAINGKRTLRLPKEGSRPRVREGSRAAPKSLASRDYQLASGHSMTVPSLKERLGWMDRHVLAVPDRKTNYRALL